MRKYYINVIKLLAITGMTGGAIGCKKFVEISPPTTLVVTADVFNSDASATAAQTAIYSQMENYEESYLMALQSGLLADELTNYSTSSEPLECYENSMQSKDITSPWINAYGYIYDANSIINGLETYSGVTAAAKEQLMGEAKFIRAFWHFYLTNCYGNVPLVTTTDFSANGVISRTVQSVVYQQIIADLKDAENSLNVNYVDATDSIATGDRVRPTKWAAAAMLARVYLYTGSYDSAEQQSTLVINNTGQYSLCGLDSVFLMNSSEAIWQIPPIQPTSNYATPDGEFFILTAAPSTYGNGNCATISPQLLNSFEPNDQRMVNWIGYYTDGTDSFYFPYKYKVQNSASGLAEYTMVLRLGEQFLIRAEARAQQGNVPGALQDLNAIRARAGLGNYSGATDKSSLESAILHERQVELFAEWGHRWFDLMRTNSGNSVLGVVTPLKGGGAWNSDDALFPIPLTELTADPNLVQNPGYN